MILYINIDCVAANDNFSTIVHQIAFLICSLFWTSYQIRKEQKNFEKERWFNGYIRNAADFPLQFPKQLIFWTTSKFSLKRE